ncbi:hypothetical protein CEXT_808121 [Caerostris extrusa]|uniref:Uncharacterized protein n=1 Tax=Caerostris extrusa TaxID=172846 RepID=A0AAV4Q312_CAEEX|nr:hypothetical protein CEXT_808121 [Caerostris extrusa]
MDIIDSNRNPGKKVHIRVGGAHRKIFILPHKLVQKKNSKVDTCLAEETLVYSLLVFVVFPSVDSYMKCMPAFSRFLCPHVPSATHNCTDAKPVLCIN